MLTPHIKMVSLSNPSKIRTRIAVVHVEFRVRETVLFGVFHQIFFLVYNAVALTLPPIVLCRTDFADIQNKKECGGNKQWQNHYLRNWAADTSDKAII